MADIKIQFAEVVMEIDFELKTDDTTSDPKIAFLTDGTVAMDPQGNVIIIVAVSDKEEEPLLKEGKPIFMVLEINDAAHAKFPGLLKMMVDGTAAYIKAQKTEFMSDRNDLDKEQQLVRRMKMQLVTDAQNMAHEGQKVQDREQTLREVQGRLGLQDSDLQPIISTQHVSIQAAKSVIRAADPALDGPRDMNEMLKALTNLQPAWSTMSRFMPTEQQGNYRETMKDFSHYAQKVILSNSEKLRKADLEVNFTTLTRIPIKFGDKGLDCAPDHKKHRIPDFTGSEKDRISVFCFLQRVLAACECENDINAIFTTPYKETTIREIIRKHTLGRCSEVVEELIRERCSLESIIRHLETAFGQTLRPDQAKAKLAVFKVLRGEKPTLLA